MTKLDTVKQLLQRISDISDWKFALGLHIRFTNPTLLYQTYPQSWIDVYNEEGLIFNDPTVRWAIAHTGICDWSDLADQDVGNVLGKAADYGLRYGKAISIGQDSRTFGFFAHPTREIVQTDIEEAHAILKQLHDLTQGIELLPDKEVALFRELNVQ